jgi:hypothetical protein
VAATLIGVVWIHIEAVARIRRILHINYVLFPTTRKKLCFVIIVTKMTSTLRSVPALGIFLNYYFGIVTKYLYYS